MLHYHSKNWLEGDHLIFLGRDVLLHTSAIVVVNADMLDNALRRIINLGQQRGCGHVEDTSWIHRVVEQERGVAFADCLADVAGDIGIPANLLAISNRALFAEFEAMSRR